MVVKPDELVYRVLQRLPTRMLSLRTIVIVSMLAVVVLVLTLGHLGVDRRHPRPVQPAGPAAGLGGGNLGDVSTLSAPARPADASPPGRQPGPAPCGSAGDVGAPNDGAAGQRLYRQHHHRRH